MFLYTIFKIFVSGLWQLFNIRNRFYNTLDTVSVSGNWFYFFNPVQISFTFILVSGLSCRKHDSCHSYIDGFYYVPIGLTLNPFFEFLSSFSCNIYAMNWMNFFLFSFDVIILPLYPSFVNTYFDFSLYFYYFIHIIYFKSVIFQNFYLFLENLFFYKKCRATLNSCFFGTKWSTSYSIKTAGLPSGIPAVLVLLYKSYLLL